MTKKRGGGERGRGWTRDGCRWANREARPGRLVDCQDGHEKEKCQQRLSFVALRCKQQMLQMQQMQVKDTPCTPPAGGGEEEESRGGRERPRPGAMFEVSLGIVLYNTVPCLDTYLLQRSDEIRREANCSSQFSVLSVFFFLRMDAAW